jgi:hypothetical protein
MSQDAGCGASKFAVSATLSGDRQIRSETYRAGSQVGIFSASAVRTL